MSFIHGDFSQLADKYDTFRPDYSESVLTAVLSQLNKPIKDCEFADVGAGTGIWSRMLASRGCKHLTAVEPNDEMRKYGSAHAISNIDFIKGSGEITGLDNESCDLVSMASSFHWVDFDAGTKEFHRILKKDGLFVALWNPRHLDASPLLKEIEAEIYNIKPDLTRVSSGASGVTATLQDKLSDSPLFKDVLYFEGRHTVTMTAVQYIGVWESVNDIRVQLGEEKFKSFIAFIHKKINHLETIEASYTTRAWVAKKA